jgi:hypothetical protein
VLQQAAGYSAERGRHINPRSHVDPPDSLGAQIFPFVDPCLESVKQAIAGGRDKHTALRFLNKLKNLRTIALQDVAVLISHGRKHQLFDLPVFKTEEFNMFQQEVLKEIDACEHLRTQDKICDIAPELAQRLDSVPQTSALCCRRMDEGNRAVGDMTNEITRLTSNLERHFSNLDNDRRCRDEVLANQFRATADVLSPPRHHHQQSEQDLPADSAAPMITNRPQKPAALVQRPSIAPGVAPVSLTFVSATQIYNQFYNPGYVNSASMAAAESQHGKQWRRHWNQAEEQRFGRVKRAAEAMKAAKVSVYWNSGGNVS